MNISNKKLLTDLHYGNTNKSTIVNFDQLLAHPKFKKHIEPLLMKVLDLESSDNILLLDYENRKKVIKEINKFNFIKVPDNYLNEKESELFFNNADCLSMKEDLMEISNEFLGTNLTKSTNNEQDYAINHFNLTAKLGLFKYNQTQKSINSLIKKAIILNEEGKSEIEMPVLKIEVNSEKLQDYIQIKYKDTNKNKITA